MGKSINPMFSFTIRGEAPFGSAPSLIVLMSLQPAIPRQVALLQCLPPLHRLDSMFHLPAGTVNHHLTRAGEFSTGRTGNFQPELTKEQFSLFSDRTSTAYLRSNQLRLYLSSIAYLLLEAFRRLGLSGTAMARAQCQTIRLKLLKIGALVRVTVRKVWVSFSSGYPDQVLFARVFQQLHC